MVLKKVLLSLSLSIIVAPPLMAQEAAKEEDFFRIARMSVPENVILEVGGLVTLPNGDLGISTRRGDVYIVENPTSARPFYRKFASGLHEILGLEYKDGNLYCAQRGELTKLVDTDNDGRADLYETVASWPISGHYHEYSFGPKAAPDGAFFVSGNVAFGNEEWWRGESRVPWRGWIFKVAQNGQIEPWATGVRSPAGLGMIDGELFYTDNQGDWIGSGAVWHVKKGAFMGHPAGLRWSGLPNSPVKLTTAELYALANPRQERNAQGRAIKPENVVDEKFVTLIDMKKNIPAFTLPAVWLPHAILGISNSEIIKIPEGVFGPFSGQLLVGDQGQSKIMRVFMEKVKGEFQGAAWDFRSGFQSGVLRMSWAKDGSLFVGETDRGWGSAGDASMGLQRLVWNNQVPFEMRAVRAMPDGFEIEFTKPVDKKTANNLSSYEVESFTYKYHPVYGSPPVNTKNCVVKGVKVSADGMKARIVVNNLRENYIHAIKLEGVRELDNSYSLVHPTAYYTLNNIPKGAKLAQGEMSTKRLPATQNTAAKPAMASKGSSDATTTTASAAAKKPAALKPTFASVKPLLLKNTCVACHNELKRQVGPAYAEIAKRKYSINQIVRLIYNPNKANWPEYETEMPPMPQVPKAEAQKIAAWIKSLEK
jgi:cytochrome c551/c552/glucose/arabinose dehydrogenase